MHVLYGIYCAEIDCVIGTEHNELTMYMHIRMNISQHIQYAFQWMCVRYTVLWYQLEGG